tara:strand:+ start:52 stop:405 length:354 start_codon:yes stop_codon:yes gene_type:complete
MRRNRFDGGGNTKKEEEEKKPYKSQGQGILVKSFKGIADIYREATGKNNSANTPKKTPKKNPSYYDDDDSDGVTIDKNGNITYHGKKGLQARKQRLKDGLPMTYYVKPKISKKNKSN